MRFSSTFFSIFRAQRTAHSKLKPKKDLNDAQRFPAMIAHVLRSMHACSAPNSRRTRAKTAAKSRDFQSKPAQFGRKQAHTTSTNIYGNYYHLSHISITSMFAKYSQCACCAQKTCKNHRKIVRFSSTFFSFFSRATHRIFNILLRNSSERCTTTPSDDCTRFAVDARELHAELAPKRPQNRASFNRNRRNSAPQMCANKRTPLPLASSVILFIYIT